MTRHSRDMPPPALTFFFEPGEGEFDDGPGERQEMTRLVLTMPVAEALAMAGRIIEAARAAVADEEFAMQVDVGSGVGQWLEDIGEGRTRPIQERR